MLGSLQAVRVGSGARTFVLIGEGSAFQYVHGDEALAVRQLQQVAVLPCKAPAGHLGVRASVGVEQEMVDTHVLDGLAGRGQFLLHGQGGEVRPKRPDGLPYGFEAVGLFLGQAPQHHHLPSGGGLIHPAQSRAFFQPGRPGAAGQGGGLNGEGLFLGKQFLADLFEVLGGNPLLALPDALLVEGVFQGGNSLESMTRLRNWWT